MNRQHKPQAAILLNKVEVAQGRESVLVVELLLNNRDTLRAGTGRTKAEHKEDLAALETLAARGYTEEEFTRLRGLVNIAKTVEEVKPISDDDRKLTLIELYEWLDEWSTHARAVLTKRSHLIGLGLAKRRKNKNENTPVTPQPVIPTPEPPK